MRTGYAGTHGAQTHAQETQCARRAQVVVVRVFVSCLIICSIFLITLILLLHYQPSHIFYRTIHHRSSHSQTTQPSISSSSLRLLLMQDYGHSKNQTRMIRRRLCLHCATRSRYYTPLHSSSSSNQFRNLC